MTLTLAPEELENIPHSPQLERCLHGLLEISNFVGSVMLLDDILARIVTITSELMNVPVCSVYLCNDQHRLVLRSNIGFEPEMIGHAGFDGHHGIPGWVAEHGDVVSLRDAKQDPRYAPLPSAIELGCRAYLCAPLRIQERIIGVMTARKMVEHDFTATEILFFETVCKQVAIVIEKARMHEEKLQAERLAAVAVSLSGVAHYIKNVLLTMQGGEYLVEQGLSQGDCKSASQGWAVLRRANGKIRGLVENILNYCRSTKPTLKDLRINDMIRELVDSVGETAREHAVEIVQELDESIDMVSGDPDELYDALLNLVTNAIDAIPASEHSDVAGKVWVRTRRLDGGRNQYVIEIEDNGPGIPQENREKIFNLFFSTKGQKGTGIGLAATRRIVEAHGGTITIGEDPHRGAHFCIYLPLHPAAELESVA